MKPFVISLSLLLLFPAWTPAATLPQSGTSASECEGLSKACSAAAKELKAARDLIAGYEQHIEAADERIKLAKLEIESLKQLSALERARAVELQNVIDAEREAKNKLLELKELQEKRVRSLEKKLSRSRKLTLILGVAAGVGILLGAAK